ncbi:MAG: hypothetical protein EOP51_05505 [Sphingobacteriales bacterium]|nr:MAG: hypothetical protein EOP51_05505 [Sphingobacteriales bacterium]
MKQQARELLVTTKVAQNWQDEFDQKVDELMDIVGKIDNEANVSSATEVLNVYRNSKQSSKPGKRKKVIHNDRPFEFLVFRN